MHKGGRTNPQPLGSPMCRKCCIMNLCLVLLVAPNPCPPFPADHRARTSSPAVIFFDEIDGLAMMRDTGGEGGVGVGERMLAQLLQEMDGLQVRWLMPCATT